MAAKSNNPDGPEIFLNETRKAIAKEVRATITGGDVFRLDEFQVDLKKTAKNKHGPSVLDTARPMTKKDDVT